MHNSGRFMQSYYQRMKRVERETGFENGPPFNILKLNITPLKTAPEPLTSDVNSGHQTFHAASNPA